MTDLTEFTGLVAAENGLCVVSTVRDDGTVQSSVVNAGVLRHPVSGEEVVGFVVRPDTRKLANLRVRPRTTVVIRSGWRWAAVEGPVELAGPGDPLPGLSGDGLRTLLRDVFAAAGGTHDDWATYDRVMAEERRTVVLVRPDRAYPAT
jgi:PPOX class probable F420-dependent enzyme